MKPEENEKLLITIKKVMVGIRIAACVSLLLLVAARLFTNIDVSNQTLLTVAFLTAFTFIQVILDKLNSGQE